MRKQGSVRPIDARTLIVGFVSIAVAFGTAPALAEERSQGDFVSTPPVVNHNGSLSSTVPIAVPDFHNIEPTVALTYSSQGRNGWVGVGWDLSGFSFIERGSPGRGAPRYDASDIFLLDGMELVPGTALGGTHQTRFETHLRVTRDTSNNQWIVIGKDGVKTTYTSVETTESGTFRWFVTTVQDLNGRYCQILWTEG